MSLVYAVRSEHEKTKHTPFWVIHFCVPVIGALLFLFYYLLYRNTGDSKKLKMILELTTMVFPLLISVIVGLNITLEEKASHFQTDTRSYLQNWRIFMVRGYYHYSAYSCYS